MKHENSFEIFEISPNTTEYIFHCGCSVWQRETDLINISVNFHNFGTLWQLRIKCTDILYKSCLFTRRWAKTATNAVRWLTQRLSFRKDPISIAKMTISHSEFIAVLSENIHPYITIDKFLTLPIYYKVQNAQWIEEIQCAKKKYFSS